MDRRLYKAAMSACALPCSRITVLTYRDWNKELYWGGERE